MGDEACGRPASDDNPSDGIDLSRQPWEYPDPFALHELGSVGDWDNLATRYLRQPVDFETTRGIVKARGLPGRLLTYRPFLRCLDIAKGNQARTAIIETRYIDADYRSEYSLFYSKAFAHYEDSAHRIHFFSSELSKTDVWQLPSDPGYLGYVIVRPHVRGLVGRTMLRPPEPLRSKVRTAVREQVDFFGQPLMVRAVPFIQQDARLDACAQAAAWMCHYSAFRRADRNVHRRTIGEFTEAADPGLAAGRVIPSTGLSTEQLSEVLAKFGLPPIIEDLENLDSSDIAPELRDSVPLERDREAANAAARLCCRYLNSGLPLIAIVRQWQEQPQDEHSDRHAIVVCGYSRTGPGQRISLIVNDDSRGPYLTVRDILSDHDEDTGKRRQWDHLMVPLPEKLWMTGSGAERHGLPYLLGAVREAVREETVIAANRVLERLSEGTLEARTYFSTSSRFKERLRDRCSDPIVLREYSLARMPRFVWVVEAVDADARDEGDRLGRSHNENLCVLGEVVFDATSDDFDPSVLAIRIPGLIWVRHADASPEDRESSGEYFCGTDMISSGGQYDP